jgi:type IV secretory pathway VirJ component
MTRRVSRVITLVILAGVLLLVDPLAAQTGSTRAAADSVGDLPLSVVPAPDDGALLAVLLTGDGGWAAGDKSLAQAFAARNVAVVGLSSPRYLIRRRTPDEAAADLARILRHFLSAWNRRRVLIVGYSRGADIGPFMVSRLPPDLRRRVDLLVLLGPGERTSFKFGLADLIRDPHGPDALPVAPEVARLRHVPVLCIYGATDRSAICRSLEQAGVARAVVRSGGHVVHGDEGPRLVAEILAALSTHSVSSKAMEPATQVMTTSAQRKQPSATRSSTWRRGADRERRLP